MKFTKLETLFGTIVVGSVVVKLALATGLLALLTKVGVVGGMIGLAGAIAYDAYERTHPKA